MGLRDPRELIEDLAALVVLAEGDERASLEQGETLLGELVRCSEDQEHAIELRDAAKRCLEVLTGVLAREDLTDTAELIAHVEALQAVARVHPPGVGSATEGETDATDVLDQPVLLGGAGAFDPDAIDGEHGGGALDPETVEQLGAFIPEALEELSRADQLLINVEHDGISAETVNDLFRVFHTIKGVSSFFALRQVKDVAHRTETLLSLVREGHVMLEGPALDVVFDATATLRALLVEAHESLGRGDTWAALAEVEPLLARLEAAGEGRELAERLPHVAPGSKLGEILVESGLPAASIEAALAGQRESHRRLGEELVAQGAIPPKKIAQALRAQSKANSSRIKETIKVDLERVEQLVEMIGELVIVESMVVNAPEIAAISSHELRNRLGQMTKILRDLQGLGMRMRMVPVRGVFQKMARLVRDVSQKSGKQVRIQLAGESVEMDRAMVEQIADPLVHLIRNAIDHGIEPPAARVKAGKPEAGAIRLSAAHEGSSIAIEIADDGRGLDREAIVRRARGAGLIAQGAELADAEVDELIFAPGFSTAERVTELSGRGVGMDVVKRNIEALRGRIQISSVPGQGTTFKLVLPLTLAIIEGMLVRCGAEQYIIPTLSIVESIQPTASMLFSLAERGELLNLRGQVVPLVRLDQLLGIAAAKQNPTEALVVIVQSLKRKVGLLVDEVVTQQQVVIKPLGTGLQETPIVSGAAIRPDGQVALILDVDRLASVIR